MAVSHCGSWSQGSCGFSSHWNLEIELQELAEKLAEPLQQRISTKFFTGAMALQNAPEAADEGAAAAGAAAPATAHTELAQQLAEARQAAAASVQVCLPGLALPCTRSSLSNPVSVKVPANFARDIML